MRNALVGLVSAVVLALSAPAQAAGPTLSSFYAVGDFSDTRSSAGALSEHQVRYHRSRRLYNAGMAVGIGGMVAFGPSAFVFISSAFGGNEPVAMVSGVLMLGSASAAITGVFAANIGAANADAAVARAFGYRPSPWAGVAGVTVFFLGIALVPVTQGFSLVGSAFGGFGLAAAQMARAKGGLRDHRVGWYLTPTTQGVMVGLTY